MRILLVMLMASSLLSACESRDGKRSDLETFFMNLGQIVFDSAKEARRPVKND